jgi:hypothetical protein
LIKPLYAAYSVPAYQDLPAAALWPVRRSPVPGEAPSVSQMRTMAVVQLREQQVENRRLDAAIEANLETLAYIINE